MIFFEKIEIAITRPFLKLGPPDRYRNSLNSGMSGMLRMSGHQVKNVRTPSVIHFLNQKLEVI